SAAGFACGANSCDRRERPHPPPRRSGDPDVCVRADLPYSFYFLFIRSRRCGGRVRGRVARPCRARLRCAILLHLTFQEGTRMRTGLITAVLTLIPAAAFAHTGAADAHGFISGFAHPFGGLDHVLAMVTVGILAWQLGGRALVLVPATFVLVTVAGAALGLA